MANQLPAMDMSDTIDGCCPVFDPKPWDGKEFSFDGLRFAGASTKSLFYMPLNMDAVMRSSMGAISASGASPKDRYLTLSEDVSPWKGMHYFLVTKPVPGLEEVAIGGTWLAKVFDGPFNQMGRWYKELSAQATRNGKKPSRMMAFYTTCPSCAKKSGHNYVVLFAKI